MADPTTEGDALLNPKGLRKLFEAVSLRDITDNCEAGHVASQKRRGCAQREITSLSGNQAANENQLKSGAWLRTARATETQRETDAGLRDKKQFVAIRSKLGIRLRGSGYDRCRVAISRPGK